MEPTGGNPGEAAVGASDDGYRASLEAWRCNGGRILRQELHSVEAGEAGEAGGNGVEADLCLLDLSALLLQPPGEQSWMERVEAFCQEPTRREALGRVNALVWPVVAAISDDPELVEALLGAWPSIAPKRVVFVVPRLDASTKRGLAAGRPDEVFDALFHRSQPSERPLAAAARKAGWEVWWPRPIAPAEGNEARARRQEISGRLLVAGDLLLRSGQAVRGHSLLRAGRWTEESRWDPGALERDGNLDVLPWLDDEARALVREWVQGGVSPVFDKLVAEFASEMTPEAIPETAPKAPKAPEVDEVIEAGLEDSSRGASHSEPASPPSTPFPSAD